MRSVFLSLALAAAVAGCTHVSVSKLDAARYPAGLVCIERNPKVLVEDFTAVVQSEFLRHGIETEVYDTAPPSGCAYTLTYTALRRWDLVPFMNYAEINLKKDSRTIASATYRHGGGFALTKFSSTETKLSPVIDELLADFNK